MASGEEERHLGLPTLPGWLSAQARESLARRDRWPQSLLIAGPEGIGKRALALNFAAALLCEQPREGGGACGACASCRYAAAGGHPDLRRVEPVEIDDDGNLTPTEWITIDAIRALTDWTRITSHRRGAKVAVIAPAERMNAAAANALLKTLEEPPPGTHLLLVAHRPGRLPATIASRCERLALARPSREDARGWLVSEGVADADRLLAQARGAPLVARSLADAALQDERTAWLDELARPESMSPLALAARIDAAGREYRRDRLLAAIDWLIGWTSDLARASAGGEAATSPDRSRSIAQLAARVARVSLFRYYRDLLRQRSLSSHPLQPRLVAEALLINYRALFD